MLSLLTNIFYSIKPDWLPTWALIVLTILTAYYIFCKRTFSFFNKLGIPGPSPLPLIGTGLPMFKDGIFKHDLDMKKYGNLVGTFFGHRPLLMVYDKSILKQILIKDFHLFQNRFKQGLKVYPLNKILVNLDDEHWKHVRNVVAPTFTGKKMRKIINHLMRSANILCENIEKKLNNDEVIEFRSLTGAYTMDVIASSAFGVQIDSHNDPQNEFVKMATKAMTFSLLSLRIIIAFFFPFLIKPLSKIGYSIFPKDVLNFFVEAIDKTMQQRSIDKTKESDFLQLLMDVHNKKLDENSKNIENEDKSNYDAEGKWIRKGLDKGEILGQGFIFFLAGFETTANTIALLAYHLAIDPQIQDRLYNEIKSVYPNKEDPDYDSINKLIYLDMCLNETLRMYPAGVRTDRTASQDVTINGVFIPKGTIIAVPIYALHMDPDVWPNPDVFDPERFVTSEKERHDVMDFIPFSTGPRNCVGMRFAVTEMKVTIIKVLQKFQLVRCPETQVPLKMQKFAIKGEDGIKIKAIRRRNE